MTGGGDDTPYTPTPVLPCDQVKLQVALQSPQPEVVARLTVDEVLAVSLETEDGIRRVAVRKDLDLAGTVVASGMDNLVRCLQQGLAFEAQVLEIDGGLVRVEIRPSR